MDLSTLTEADTAVKSEDDDRTFKEYKYSGSDLTTQVQLKLVMKN